MCAQCAQSLLCVAVTRSYICAVGPDVMYVAFMGTKQARDLVTDVYVTHEPMWAESLALATDNQVRDTHTCTHTRARAHELAWKRLRSAGLVCLVRRLCVWGLTVYVVCVCVYVALAGYAVCSSWVSEAGAYN